jgi:hypothetical protein
MTLRPDRSSAGPPARSRGDLQKEPPRPAPRTWPWRWCPAENIRSEEEYAQARPEGKENECKNEIHNPAASKKAIYFAIPSEARNFSPV